MPENKIPANDDKDIEREIGEATTKIQDLWKAEPCDYEELSRKIAQLAKKRGLHRKVLNAIVKLGMEILEGLPETPASIIENHVISLRNVTEGKITVEKERAELTLRLSHIKEKEGNIREASEIIQEVQVETFGSVDNKKKTEFILEQMRLCLLDKDIVKVYIISEKINKKVFLEPEYEKLKIEFFELMAKYYTHSHEYFQMYGCFKELLDTNEARASTGQSAGETGLQKLEVLTMMACILLLAERSPEQLTEVQHILENKDMDDLPDLKKFLTMFTKTLIISWSAVERQYREQWKAFKPLSELVPWQILWQDLRDRVIEFDINVISKHFSLVTLKRIAEILELEEEEAERYLRLMVTERGLYLKIDQIEGIVSFEKPTAPEDYLNEWAGSIRSSLKYVQDVVYEIGNK